MKMYTSCYRDTYAASIILFFREKFYTNYSDIFVNQLDIVLFDEENDSKLTFNELHIRSWSAVNMVFNAQKYQR